MKRKRERKHFKTNQTKKVLVYNVHAEIFCGILDRIIILGEIFEDSRQMHKRNPLQLILGDFNTQAHSIARLSPKYARDKMR